MESICCRSLKELRQCTEREADAEACGELDAAVDEADPMHEVTVVALADVGAHWAQYIRIATSSSAPSLKSILLDMFSASL